MPEPPDPALPAWQDTGLVLAAGAGRRFGGPKAPFRLEGERLVDRAVRVLRAGGCPQVLVVLGAWRGEVPGASTSWNPHWEEGIGSSLRWGLEQLLAAPECAAASLRRRAVITLVDLPGLTPAAVARMRREAAELGAASFRGRQGHPVVIGARFWPELIGEVQGERGARTFLRRHGAQLIPLEDLACGQDLDHPPQGAVGRAMRHH
ncbi:MAG: nucleotidyltransferase family protein [Synechococcus sp.]|nr:nucleotidyltransferase family protein [Synechococcus sp.]